MKHLTNELLFAAAMFTTASSLAVAAPEKEREKPPVAQGDAAASIGHPVALMVQPEAIRLAGPRAMRQILVTGRYSDGTERDLTNLCEVRAAALDIVNIGR